MAERANITDIQVLDRFRSQLLVFIEKASSTLDEVSDEVKRTRIWLQTEQKLNLERETRRTQKSLEQLESEFFSARLTDASERKTGLQMQMRKKKQELRDLEKKIRAVQAWLRNFDSTVEVEARKVDKLKHMIDSEMKQACQFLNQAAQALADYSNQSIPPTASSSNPED